MVFSITDPRSFRTVLPLYQHVRRIHPSASIPIILVGNKSDLLRARQVPADQGEALAAQLGGVYFEASARESHEGVQAAFLHLCQEVSRALGGTNGEKRKGGKTFVKENPRKCIPTSLINVLSPPFPNGEREGLQFIQS
uniref:small monomeric GTPase n=1 Tax=Paramormyrops kingsleyae TaxID=1676925 RepID=A0A3B3R4N7_9TELE